MKMLRYGKDGGKAEVVDIPADQKEKAEELHNALVEKAAESDESLMELFFANNTLTEKEIRKGISKGIIYTGHVPCILYFSKTKYRCRHA